MMDMTEGLDEYVDQFAATLVAKANEKLKPEDNATKPDIIDATPYINISGMSDTSSNEDNNVTPTEKQTQVQDVAKVDNTTWDNIIDNAKVGIAGVRRFTQGLAKDLVNITGGDTTEIDKQIKEREDYIADTLDKLGQDPNSMFNTANLSQMAVEFGLPIGRLKGIVKQALAIGGLEYSASRGEGEGVALSAMRGTAAATTGGVAAWAAPKVGKVVAEPILEAMTGVSSTARLAAKKVGLSPSETKNFLEGIPKDEQTLALANAYPKLLGNLKQAIGDSDRTRILAEDLITTRTNEIKKAAQANDFEKIKEAAEDMYGTMKATLDDAVDVKVDVSGLSDGISLAKRIGGDESAIAKLKGFEEQIKDAPNMKIGDVIELREGINDLLRKSKGKPRAVYGQMLSNLDSKINDKNIVPEEYSRFIDDSVSSYRNMKQQEELIGLIKKASTQPRGQGGGGEASAINYGKLKQLIKDESLDSPEVKATLEVAEAFEKRFNSDYSIFGATKTKGTNPQEGMLTVWSELVAVAKEKVWRFGEFGENIKIQNAIKNAIASSKTPVEFSGKVIRNKDIPQSIKDNMLKHLENIKGLSKQEANRASFIIKENSAKKQ